MLFMSANICLRCKVFCSKIWRERVSTSTADSYSAYLENVDILRNLGFSIPIEQDLSKVISKKEPHTLKMTVESINNLGFDTNQIALCPAILKYKRRVIDHRFKVFEEGGFNKITLPMILNFVKFVSLPVQDLKKRGFIDASTNVTKNVLRYCNLPSNLYPPYKDDSHIFEFLQEIAVQYYLCWEFNLSMNEVQKAFMNNPRLRRNSLRLILENYMLLTTNVGLKKELIRQNLYLLAGHPKNYLDLLESVPVIGLQPVRDVGKAHPKLLMRPSTKLLEILQILKDFNIPPESLTKHPDVLCLSPDTVRSRLQILHSDPNFRPFFHHPRICRIIIYFKSVTKRFEQLTDTKWRTKSLEMLSVHSSVFQGRLKMGFDMSKGNDIVHYLHKELKIKRRKIRERMTLNPYWFCVPLTTVNSTLELLKEANFDPSHIYDSLTVVLYPREEVAKFLQLVESKPELECCRDPATGQLRPELVLRLVLYFLERPFHFTGNGIWFPHAESTPDNAPDHTSLIYPIL